MTASTGEPDTRARPIRVVALVAVLLLVAFVALLVSGRIAGGPSGPTGGDLVEGVLTDQPRAPVVLPESVPAGYVLAGGDTADGPSGGVPVTAWVFRPLQAESGLAVIQLCIAPPGRCTADPASALDRQVDGREVAVVAFGDASERTRSLELWGDVRLTGDWQSLGWIDEALPRTGLLERGEVG